MKKREGNWKRRAAIERLCGRGHEAVAEIDGNGEVTFNRDDNFDYYLVNTDAFAAIAPKGSVIEVYTSDVGVTQGDVVLVAGRQQLELMHYRRSLKAQVLGTVSEVRSWAGRQVQHYLN